MKLNKLQITLCFSPFVVQSTLFSTIHLIPEVHKFVALTNLAINLRLLCNID